MSAGAGSTLTIRDAMARFRTGKDDVLREDGESLLALALGKPRSWLYAHSELGLDAASVDRLETLCHRRTQGEPMAYLIGHREFWSLDVAVTRATLVPRPETELLVELALRLCTQPQAEVLDLGTGSGAIALALASERPDWRLMGVDRDPDTLAVACGNAARLGVTVEFRQGDWFLGLDGRRFDLVVSNPPYISDTDPCLDSDGLRCEPRAALAAGSDGLDALRMIISRAPFHLRDGAALACEHGAGQGADVRDLFAAAGFADVTTERDLAGLERVTHGRLPAERSNG